MENVENCLLQQQSLPILGKIAGKRQHALARENCGITTEFNYRCKAMSPQTISIQAKTDFDQTGVPYFVARRQTQ